MMHWFKLSLATLAAHIGVAVPTTASSIQCSFTVPGKVAGDSSNAWDQGSHWGDSHGVPEFVLVKS